MPAWVLWTTGTLAVVVAAAVATAAYGTQQWRLETDDVRSRIDDARRPPAVVRFGAADLAGLPAPVQRYLGAVLVDGQPVIIAARFSQEGEFLLDEAAQRWAPFRATHLATTAPPAFDWDARMRMAPGLAVRVRDAYVDGEGWLRAAVLGLFTVAAESGTPELNEGELMRYLAEAVWYPTVLLPGQGVTWEPVDASMARARLSYGRTSVALNFRFGADGLIAEVAAGRRYRLVGGTSVPTPWRGRFTGYGVRSGMRVPLEGEVEWVLPQGPQPYWRGRLTEVSYELAR